MKTMTARRDGDSGGPYLDYFAKVPAAVQDSPDLHDIAYDYIEDCEVPHLDAVVGILPFLSGAVGLKGLRAMQPLLYRGLNGIHQIFGGYGILEPERDVIHDPVQVLLEEREYPQFITPSAHGYAPSLG